MKNLDIYFSDACNSNCQYCIMRELEHNNNTAIRQALEDNSFVSNVRHVLTPETTSIGFWGREPSVNGAYFSNFIYNLLDYSPYIRYIVIPTNGQSDNFYEDFIAPLYCYCNSHKRKIILMIQFSLDGPADLQDRHRGEGSSDKCVHTIKHICKTFPFSNKYLRLRLSTKSTITGYELENYSFSTHNKFMTNLYFDTKKYFIRKDDCKIGITGITLEVPGNYTVTQGKALVNWRDYFLIVNERQPTSCTAGTDSRTIDYLGNLYDCHLLANKTITPEQFRNQFELTMNTLVQNGEAIEQDRDKLFNAVSSIYCWGATDKNLESYIRLLGNGFLL